MHRVSEADTGVVAARLLEARKAAGLTQQQVEQAGVHVFYGSLPSGLAGLYAFVPDLGYCILINRKHPPERRRWTLSHEYGHFLADRHKPGIDYVQVPGRKSLSERFADAFAASFLMPGTAMRRYFVGVSERTGDFQTADLSRLAHHFYVSAHAGRVLPDQSRRRRCVVHLVGPSWIPMDAAGGGGG